MRFSIPFLGADRSTLFTRDFSSLFTAHLLFGLSFWPYVLLPVFLQDLGADLAQVGLLMGAASLSGILIRPWIGPPGGGRRCPSRRAGLKMGDHTMIIGEIVDAPASDQAPLLYDEGSYYRVGERVRKPQQDLLNKIRSSVEKHRK
jgi:hypothetical protein